MWKQIRQDCKEHLRLETMLNNWKLATGVVYWWTGSHEDQNTKMANCLHRFGNGHEIMTIGSLNAHVEELDGRTDSNDHRLLEMVEQ